MDSETTCVQLCHRTSPMNYLEGHRGLWDLVASSLYGQNKAVPSLRKHQWKRITKHCQATWELLMSGPQARHQSACDLISDVTEVTVSRCGDDP